NGSILPRQRTETRNRTVEGERRRSFSLPRDDPGANNDQCRPRAAEGSETTGPNQWRGSELAQPRNPAFEPHLDEAEATSLKAASVYSSFGCRGAVSSLSTTALASDSPPPSWQTRWADSMLIVTLSSWEFPCVSKSVIRKGGLIGGILTATDIARGVEHDHCPRASS